MSRTIRTTLETQGKKILIIKTGHCETLDQNISDKVSLGDVLRTTCLLHAYKDDSVFWLTSLEAKPLLQNNPYIKSIFTMEDLPEFRSIHFDKVINLEKGFVTEGLIKSDLTYSFSSAQLSKLNRESTIFQEALFLLIDKKWGHEKYILIPKKEVPIENEIGLNWMVGAKWPTKMWPKHKWQELSQKLSKSYKISWQQGLDNIDDYVTWISSCETIVTTDSLGLHISLALEKNIIALFGPTSSKQIPLYNLGKKILPNNFFDCMPCHSPKCHLEKTCVDTITVDQIISAINRNKKICQNESFS